jgi:NCS1 family nucleobase:cation symporter-1
LPSCLLAGVVHYGLTRVFATRLGWGAYAPRGSAKPTSLNLNAQGLSND